jgi:hypothetical protein
LVLYIYSKESAKREREREKGGKKEIEMRENDM